MCIKVTKKVLGSQSLVTQICNYFTICSCFFGFRETTPK